MFVSPGPGWRAEIRPADHPVANFDFDVVVGADGRRNSLEGISLDWWRGCNCCSITIKELPMRNKM